jgi:ubiquitin-protein ligase E3 D
MSEIYLYAEILAHVGQVSFYASLQTTQEDETRIEISSDRRMITVSHNDDKASMFLPTGVGGQADVTIPAERKLDLSLRLELEDLAGLPSLDELKSQNEYPWLAEDMQAETSVRCKECKIEIIKPGDITTWKDLPSESWAEMMDLWHCHKPHDERTDSDGTKAASGKGYAPSSRITAARNTGLLDISSILIDSQDCHNIQVSNNEPSLTLVASFSTLDASFAIILGEKKETFSTPTEGTYGLVADTITLERLTPRLVAEMYPPL